jgi:serine O-acetyltransferase
VIQSKEDYLFYCEADRVALNISSTFPQIFTHEVWRFERLLRKVEYFKNCRNSLIYKPYFLYLYLRFRRLSVKMGFHIPPNVFGPGLSIAHPGTLIVNDGAQVGENCRIHNCVHIGTQAGFTDAAPKIGNNVFIGPGVVLFGDIEVADNIAIGANAVVNRSFTEEGITIAGVPARKVSDKGFDRCYKKSTEIIRRRNT